MQKFTVLLSALGFLLLGCQGEPKGDQNSSDWSETLEGAKQTLKSYAPDTKEWEKSAGEEMEKLFTFEYHVAELDRTLDAQALTDKLQALGKNRWDCFHLEPKDKVLQLFCKRRPQTYLRYVPRLFNLP